MRISRRASLYSRKRQFSLSDVAAGETVYIPEKGVFKPYIVMGHNIYETGEYVYDVEQNSTIDFARTTYYCRYGTDFIQDPVTGEFILQGGGVTRVTNLETMLPVFVGTNSSISSTSVPTKFETIIYGTAYSGGTTRVTITGNEYLLSYKENGFAAQPTLLLRKNLFAQQVFEEIESNFVVDTNKYLESALKDYLEGTFFAEIDIEPLLTYIKVGQGGSSTSATINPLKVFPPSLSETGVSDSPVNDGELLNVFTNATLRKATDEDNTARRYWTRTPDQAANTDDVYTRIYVISQYGMSQDVLTSRTDTWVRPEFSLSGKTEIDPETMQIII